MTKELDDALVRDFPSLYRKRNLSPSQTCMCWGFPADGWEPLIRELSAKLEPLGVVAEQVKEKFGTLRFYWDDFDRPDLNESVYKLIGEAETKSAKICEYCGQPGTLGGRGWLRTLCEGCRKKKNPGT